MNEHVHLEHLEHKAKAENPTPEAIAIQQQLDDTYRKIISLYDVTYFERLYGDPAVAEWLLDEVLSIEQHYKRLEQRYVAISPEVDEELTRRRKTLNKILNLTPDN